MHSTAASLRLPPTSPPFYHYSSTCHRSRFLPDPLLTSSAALGHRPHLPPPSGLRTPPGDCGDTDSAMGTTYQPPPSATYEDHRHGPSYPPAYNSFLSEADRRRSILSELTNSAVLSNGGRSSSNSFRSESSQTVGHSGSYDRSTAAMASSAQQLRDQVYNQTYQPRQHQADAVASASDHLEPQIVMSTHSFSSDPSTPASTHLAVPPAQTTNSSITITEQDSASMVMHSLEVPRCIDPRGGSLSTFTAELTCLFWFESPIVYQLADSIDGIPPNIAISRVCANAIPNPSFKAWVTRMLTTTQVTQNVVFLALLFIYRLKSLNPRVRGKPGSECRLLTVALMLGNKFLDDNTYTNKTWSDVSTLNVKDIHVMEVEFLSNMRYSLLVSATEWKEWLVKLAKFRMYYERASTVNLATPQAVSPQRPFASPVPSPTGAQPNVPSLAAGSNMPIGYDAASYSPTRPVYASASANANAAISQQQPWPAAYPNVQVSPLAGKPDTNAFGKRAHGYDDLEPPPKRAVRPGQQPSASLPPVSASLGSVIPAQPVDPFVSVQPVRQPAPVADTVRLPVPHLTLNTASAAQAAQTHLGGPSLAGASFPVTGAGQASHVPQVALSLPPLTHGVRAMSTVYSSSGNVGVGAGGSFSSTSTASGAQGYTSKLPVLPAAGPNMGPNMGVPGGAGLATGGTTPTGFAPPAFGTPTKRMSPMNALTPSAASAYATAVTSSPLTESFQHVSTGHTPISHSPSLYLQQRTSPYRPIRHVNTLLNPPPTSLQEYPASGPLLIPPTQMYYQPLGRRNDLRTGIVPEFQGLQFASGAVRQGFGLGSMQQMQQMQAMQAQGMALQLGRVPSVQQPPIQAIQQQLPVHSQAYAPHQPHYGHPYAR